MYLFSYNPIKKPCPFCNINKEKTKIVSSKPYTMVSLSNPRLVPGHLLVIPKRHIEKLFDLTKKEKNEIIDTVIEFQKKILSRVSSGCDIRINYRPFQKQSRLKVDHLHIHLIPREFKDDIYKKIQINETKLFKNLSPIEVKKISSLLKENR